MTAVTVTHVLLVGAGGALGSMARFATSAAVHKFLPAAFPYGTMAVNVAGCLAIGLAAGLAESRDVMTPGTRVFLLAGVFGGFTTFSTFGHETHSLFREGQHLHAGANVLLTVALCLLGAWLGHWLGVGSGSG